MNGNKKENDHHEKINSAVAAFIFHPSDIFGRMFDES